MFLSKEQIQQHIYAQISLTAATLYENMEIHRSHAQLIKQENHV